MIYLLILLVLANIAVRSYDVWSTIKIKRGPDGKLGTKDDGIEKNRIMLFLMDRLGVVPAIVLWSSLVCLVAIGIFAGWYFGYVHDLVAVGGLFGMAAWPIFLFSRYNFRNDGIGER